MKKLVTFISIFLLWAGLYAQTPQAINYQGLARDNAGNILANQTVSLRLSILAGSIAGTAVYVETHTPVTDANGLFALMIGQGTVVTGTFGSITWGNNSHYLKVEMDPSGGTSFQLVGTSQFAAVPYAMYATSSGGSAPGNTAGDMQFWNGSAWVLISAGTYGQQLFFCNGVPTWGGCPPLLSTDTVTAITATTATSGGNVTNDGGSAVTARGICYSTSPWPTISATIVASGSGTGSFTASLTGLSPATTYYIRAFATNSHGTDYGNQRILTTLALPTLTTTATTAITSSTATSGGDISTDGGAAVTARGVCWSTSANPTIALSTKTIDGTGVGSFSSSITGLAAGTLYYIRAYATNSAGTAYGNEVSFTTLANLPTLSTTAASAITSSTATSGGDISTDGGAAITARGVCWSTSASPTITLSTKTIDGTGVGSFTSSITDLAAGTLYYIRAYATNSVGTAYGNEVSFTTLAASTPCTGIPTISVNHITGVVAPVNKSVTYGTVTNIPGEPTKCWITSNLGASNQATAVNDATEASAGWYWQFNRKQGFKHDGTTRTPATTWISNINENSDWLPANDPCALELGSGWRLPTNTEWTNVDGSAGGNWSSWNGPWNSGLKLHAAGLLAGSNGSLYDRGSSGQGNYWSSVQSFANIGSQLYFFSSGSFMNNFSKDGGLSVRCLRDLSSQVSLPIITTTAATAITSSTASSGGNITTDGGAAITARGVCWSTSANPTIALSTKTIDGTGVGSFTSSITGLAASTLYYVRAYATNSVGTAYGSEVNFTTQSASTPCTGIPTISVNHTTGVVAPVNKSVTYGTVTNIPGEPTKCWISSNLGADHQATAISDATEASAGWYWQFNRKQGFKHDGSARTPSTTWITSINENSDWLPANDPCTIELGNGWRLPTYTEWSNVDASGGWTNWTGPWNSDLKLHGAGYLSYISGSLNERGSSGVCWSSKKDNATSGWYLTFGNNFSYTGSYYKSSGLSVRCIK